VVKVFATRTCVWCKQVEKFLQLKQVQYEKVYIDDDQATRQMLFEKTGMMSVPVTSDGEQFIVGWNVGALSDLVRQQQML